MVRPMEKLAILAAITAMTFSLSAEHEPGKSPPKGPPGPHPEHMIEMMDTDKDGKVSKAEWQAHHEKHFNEMDVNKDGFVTAEEMKAMHEKMREKHRGEKGKMQKHKKAAKKKRGPDDELRFDGPSKE